MNWISKILLKIGFGNKLFRRLAALAAGGLLVYVPDLDVAQATEVFTQIVSGLVIYISGKAEIQLGNKE